MPRKATISDEMLRQYLEAGVGQSEIARLCHVSESAISQRVAALKRRQAAHADPRAVQAARVSVWDVRRKLEWAQLEAEKLLSECYAPLERVAALNCLVSQCKFVVSSLSTLYSIEEQAAFQAEVLAVLEEFEPGTREKVLQRLRDKRPVRAALLGGGGEVPQPEDK